MRRHDLTEKDLQNLKIFRKSENFPENWKIFQDLRIFQNSQTFQKISNFFENFNLFPKCFLHFFNLCSTCDIWDTDYNTDNWEPGIMAIFVTWQLIVTLDSICNSCNVWTLNWAGGITVSPGTDFTDMVVVFISLGRTPGYGVSIDCGAAKVADTVEIEGENTDRSLCRSRCSGAGRPKSAGDKGWECDLNTQSWIHWLGRIHIQIQSQCLRNGSWNWLPGWLS